MLPPRQPSRIDVLQDIHEGCEHFVNSGLTFRKYFQNANPDSVLYTAPRVLLFIVQNYRNGRFALSDWVGRHTSGGFYYVRKDGAGRCVHTAFIRVFGSDDDVSLKKIRWVCLYKHLSEQLDRICTGVYDKVEPVRKTLEKILPESMDATRSILIAKRLQEELAVFLPNDEIATQVADFLRVLYEETKNELPKPFEDPVYRTELKYRR